MGGSFAVVAICDGQAEKPRSGHRRIDAALPVAALALCGCLHDVDIQALEGGIDAPLRIVGWIGDLRQCWNVFTQRSRRRELYGPVRRQGRRRRANEGKQGSTAEIPHSDLEGIPHRHAVDMIV